MKPMSHGYVFFSTDGLRDYVEMPDGVTYILGTMSVAKLIAPLAPTNEVRRVCDAFNEGKRPRLWVDVDKLWEALETNIRRSRWASVDPVVPDLLIPAQNRNPRTPEGTIMADSELQNAIKQQVGEIEKQIALIAQKAREADNGSISKDMMEDEMKRLRGLIEQLRSPNPYGDQSKNRDFYAAAKQASVATFEQNSAIVEETLKTVEATNDTIDRLVAAGKRFDAPRAKADLMKIASRVTEITASVDLGFDWIKGDLETLAKEAAEIHDLFPKNV